MSDVKAAFMILLGIILFSVALLVVLAPENITKYTVIDTAFYKTDHRLIGKTAYDFNNASEIARFPKKIDRWKGVDFRYPERIYRILEAKIILSRAYSKGGHIIWMDIINSDKRKSFHDPRVCYGASWNIVKEGVVEIPMNNTSAAVFEKIYVNRLYLVNKKDPGRKLVAIYWFMFRGGEGVTMIRLSSPVVKNYTATYDIMKEFTRDVMNLMYREVKKPRSVGEVWIEEYGFAGYAGIAALFLPSVILICLGVVSRGKQRE